MTEGKQDIVERHTLGPWEADEEYGLWGVFDADGAPICTLFDPAVTGGRNRPHRNAKANARLIAAAPSLLEALEECADKLWVLRCNSRDPLDREAAERAFGMAAAAIAKVKP
jgi:hypothetical protein